MSTALVFASGASRVEHDALGAGRLAAGIVDLVRRMTERMPRRHRSMPDHEELLLRRRNQALATQLLAERHGTALRVGGAPAHP